MWYTEQTSAFYFFTLRTGIWIIIGTEIFCGGSLLCLIAATFGFLGLRTKQSKFIFCMWCFDTLLIFLNAVVIPLLLSLLGATWEYVVVVIVLSLWFYFGSIEYSYYNVLLRQEQYAAGINPALLTNLNSEEQQVQGQPVGGQQVQEPLEIFEQMEYEQQVQGKQGQWDQSEGQPEQWEPEEQWGQSEQHPEQLEPEEEQPEQWEPVQEQPVQEQQLQWQESQGQQELV